MKCPKCKNIMGKDTNWKREAYYKVSNLLKFKCSGCGSKYMPTYFNIATESNIVEMFCSINNRLMNWIGLKLAYDYQYIELSAIKREYKKSYENV